MTQCETQQFTPCGGSNAMIGGPPAALLFDPCKSSGGEIASLVASLRLQAARED
jgi:hypothetical protein